MRDKGIANRWIALIGLGLVSSVCLPLSLLKYYHSSPAKAGLGKKERVSEAYGKLPMRFEANAGQTDSQVKYLSRGRGYDLFLTPTEAVISLSKKKTTRTNERRSVVRMKLVGANSAAKMEGTDPLPGKSNYFIGNDPQKWRRDVTNFAKVRYENVYRGIDLVYYGNQQELEYDFVLEPGASPASVKLALNGMAGLKVGAKGDLILCTGGGELVQRKPVAYQEIAGRRKEIACHYFMTGEREVGFELGAYDHSRKLVIDPALAYSTYLGGSSDESAVGVTVDAGGNAYVVGYTSSLDFPTKNHIQSTNTNITSVFVSKLNPEGSSLIYSTYLGGDDTDVSFNETPYAIAVDSQGNAYIGGETSSPTFPTKNAVQSVLKGNVDIFVAKLNADGSDLFYSTLLGGAGTESRGAIAIDSEDNVYVSGRTTSTDYPIKNALQPIMASPSSADAFVTKLKADGSDIIYSTYIGGSDYDAGNGIAVDAVGNVYI